MGPPVPLGQILPLVFKRMNQQLQPADRTLTLSSSICYFKLATRFGGQKSLIVFLGGLDSCWKVIESLGGLEVNPCTWIKYEPTGGALCRELSKSRRLVKWPHILTVIAAAEGLSPGYGRNALHTICDPCLVRCQLCMLATSLFSPNNPGWGEGARTGNLA